MCQPRLRGCAWMLWSYRTWPSRILESFYKLTMKTLDKRGFHCGHILKDSWAEKPDQACKYSFICQILPGSAALHSAAFSQSASVTAAHEWNAAPVRPQQDEDVHVQSVQIQPERCSAVLGVTVVLRLRNVSSCRPLFCLSVFLWRLFLLVFVCFCLTCFTSALFF